MITVTFLGTGTSQGIPIIGCKCEVCTSDNTKDQRLRSSILVNCNGKNILIDAGPDFRYQMLRSNTVKLDAILLTHEHKDHIGGLDDIRPFNYMRGDGVGIYAEERVCNAIKSEFHYAFAENPYPGVPQMHLNCISELPFDLLGEEVIPIRGMHANLPVLGYRIGDFAYLTDMNYISTKELDKLSGLHTLVINALRQKQHYSHFSYSEALSVIGSVSPVQAYLTHISHDFGLYNAWQNRLPHNVHLAFDQLQIQVS